MSQQLNITIIHLYFQGRLVSAKTRMFVICKYNKHRVNIGHHEVTLLWCETTNYIPAPRRGRRVYCFTSVHLSVRPSFRPSNIFFVAFFSVTVDGRNLIFGHKLHIGTPYRGKRFLNRQIPTSCLPKSGVS